MSSPELRVPLSAPDIDETDIEAVTAVLRTSRLSLGPKLHEFETNIARYVGARHAIAVSSGTAALHLSIRALGIGEGDEVILPSFTFIAAANAIRYERAVPVFVDIEPQTLNIDPDVIERAVGPRTKAILAIHTFGCPCDLDAIQEIARRRNLLVIEDACEAIGAEFKGKRVGSLADVGTFAFYPNKQITTGEGGVIVTNNSEVASRARQLRNQGRAGSGDWFEHTELGYNYRISELNCALGISQLERIGAILGRREEIACSYHEKLRSVPGLVLPVLHPENRKISWFVYVVRLPAGFEQAQRDWIIRQLLDRGIGAARYFAPVHLQPVYRSRLSMQSTPQPDLAVTESVAARCIALPFFNRMSEAQQNEVATAFAELVTRAGERIGATSA